MAEFDGGVHLRPMTLDDADGVPALAEAAFADLARRRASADPDVPWPSPIPGRWPHLLATDPDGCWVAEDSEGLAGVSAGLRRGAVWGLSMLAVRVGVQSRGIGRALLERALATVEGAEAGLIVASDDPRAIRRYALAGFALRPTLSAAGTPDPRWLPDSPGTRMGGEADLDLTEALDLRVRGAARGADLATVLGAGGRLVVADGPRRGYAVLRESSLFTLAADDEPTAVALLARALREIGGPARVNWLDAVNLSCGHDDQGLPDLRTDQQGPQERGLHAGAARSRDSVGEAAGLGGHRGLRRPGVVGVQERRTPAGL